MSTIIKKGSSADTIRKKVEQYQKKRKNEIEKLCGSISLHEDPLVLQRKWRDEWE